MNRALLEKFGRLVVKIGVNIQQGQTLVIGAPIECAEFVRIIAETAYREGARDVVINWKDEQFRKIRFTYAPEEVFEEFPEWQKKMYNDYSEQGAAFLSIYAEDPELLRNINPKRIAKSTKASSTALKEYYDRMMANKIAWSVVSIPTLSWAQKVFPDVPPEQAVELLWNEILKTVRVDAGDPVAQWKAHQKNLKKSVDFLNNSNFKYLKYKNSIGTDLTIELPENHVWAGGADYTTDGIEFIANMPTEEVFTMPVKTGVNGTVVSSKPLNYNGNLVKNFTLIFKDGRIVDYKAEKGYETLKSLIDTDEGSHYLGEVALVPVDSPISKSEILFYNTLFDENASCHLAIGKAYPTCIKNGENMSPEELEAAGANDSLTHEDFMVGTPDLEIIGVKSTGEKIPVFINGKFAF